MSEIINQTNWADFLREYSSQNQGRYTRLGVFEANEGVANDYWIEDGLPLVALDFYSDKDKARVDIVFDNYTHAVQGPTTLVRISGDSADQGLDIVDTDGKVTLLRFENWTE